MQDPFAGAGLGRIAALDGIRAGSIALVVLSHFGLQRWVPGIFGVNVFFFVSGLLITRLLLLEVAEAGGIGLGRFYLRRALRLYPALLVAIAAGGALYVGLGGRLRLGDLLAALFYLANYWEIDGGFDSDLAGSAHPYGILWSLAVEEHFYLFYPMLLLATRGAVRRLLGIIGAMLVLVFLWRLRVTMGCLEGGCAEMRVLHATDTRIDSILYGAGLTVLLAGGAREAVLRVLRAPVTFPLGVAMLLGSLLVREAWFRDVGRFSVQGIGLGLAIGALLFGGRAARLRRLLESRPAVALGRWSYGLYLWHWIVLMVGLQALAMPDRLAMLSGDRLPDMRVLLGFSLPAMMLSVALAAGSYRWVERPVLGWRRRFGSRA